MVMCCSVSLGGPIGILQPNSRFDELPEEPLGFDPFKGSFDMDGDPATTNLYVGNLAPQVCAHAPKQGALAGGGQHCREDW